MANSKQSASEKMQEKVQQPTPPAQDEDEDEEMDDAADVEIKVDGEIEKDETEEELERLVFGDSAGFREGLRDFSLEEEEGAEGEDEAPGGLEGLDDAQVGQTVLK